jgi:hypothetical protein
MVRLIKMARFIKIQDISNPELVRHGRIKTGLSGNLNARFYYSWKKG